MSKPFSPLSSSAAPPELSIAVRSARVLRSRRFTLLSVRKFRRSSRTGCCIRISRKSSPWCGRAGSGVAPVSSEMAGPEADRVPVQLVDSGLIRWGAGTALAVLAVAFVVYVAGDTVLAIVATSIGLYKRDPVIFSIVAYQF